jgi:hypothetical protein
VRVLIAVLGVAAGLTLLGWLALSGQTSTCEVCVSFRGREACRTASAASVDEAQRHAQATACALVTNGVTQDLECQRSRPTAQRCE